MKEQIIEYLKKLAGNWDSYIIGEKTPELITYDQATNQIFKEISEEIKKVENPYGDYKLHSQEGFENCRKEILSLLEK